MRKVLSNPVLECIVGDGSKGHQRPPYISRALLLYKSGLIKYSCSLARSIAASCFFSQTAALKILLVFWLKPDRLVERGSTNLVWKFLLHPVLECKVGGGSKGHHRPPYISRALLLYKSGLIKYSRSLARSITASCFFSQTAALEILLVFWLKQERPVKRGTMVKMLSAHCL